MAFTPYQNITSAVAVELIASGENVSSISSILIANTHATSDIYIDLYLDLHSRDYYFMKGYMLKKGETLILNPGRIDNSSNGFGLFIKLTGISTTSPTVDVIVSR